MIKLINESNNLSDFRGNSRFGNATRVRIKATGRTGWVESVVDDKWGQGIRVIYDDQPGMYPDFFTVDEVEIIEPVKKQSNNLSDFRGNSRFGHSTRVRIKSTGRTGWVDSVVDDKWSQGIRVVYDDQRGMYPEFFTVDEVEILESVKKRKTESFNDDFEQYTYVKSKDVNDADGYLTEYTMYYDEVEDKYVFVFGDSDIYNPNDGYEEFDYECDTEREADEWFDNYEGFEDLD